MCVVEIIPVLPVQEPCNWCEPQQCYTAGVWWGECLLSFYTTDPTRLEPDALNQAACDVLREVTKALLPESDTIIAADTLIKSMAAHELCCFWADFRPAVALAYPNRVVIPLPE